MSLTVPLLAMGTDLELVVKIAMVRVWVNFKHSTAANTARPTSSTSTSSSDTGNLTGSSFSYILVVEDENDH